MNAIIPHASIYERAANRDRAITLFAQAFDTLAEAAAAAAVAAPSGVYDLPALHIGAQGWPERDRDRFLEKAQLAVDRGVWSDVVHACGFSRLMDKTAHEAFRAELRDNPPAATVENLEATLARLMEDRDLIFKRGVATAFSRLDRRFRSHDGFKIGGRIVLSHAFDAFGIWNYRAKHDETLVDVERAFYLLDHQVQPDRLGGIYGVVSSARRDLGLGAQAFTAEDAYFRVRGFKNGNLHLWFKRPDLVERVNLLLADYYGAAIGAAPEAAGKHHAPTPGRAMAKNYGYFPTPAALVDRVLDEARIYPDLPPEKRGSRYRILEPSAGTAALASPAAQAGHEVTCVEIQPQFAEQLRRAGAYRKVVEDDFLSLNHADLGQFDRILMNPPFDKGLDVEHVAHALRFLAPGGVLVAIVSAGVAFREDRRTTDLREDVLRRYGGRIYDLPMGSFAEAGTMVNTCLLVARAPQ